MEFENCIIYDSFIFECIPLYPRTQYLQLYSVYVQSTRNRVSEREPHTFYYVFFFLRSESAMNLIELFFKILCDAHACIHQQHIVIVDG